MSTDKTTQQRAALLAAVEAGDVGTIRGLLGAGLNPAAAFKTKTAYEVALDTGEEALVQPFIEAFRRDPGSDRHLGRIAWWVFEDDRFSASFAGSLVAYVTGGKGGERALVYYAGLLLGHGITTGKRLVFHERRQDVVLAGKVALAIADGWLPGAAWVEGRLPHHQYLDKGLIEAALACVAGGANPDEPTREFGLRAPEEQFRRSWPDFQARLRAERAAHASPTPSSTSRTRQCA
jgi:hypothetical protein